MWLYKSPIGPLYIKQLQNGTFGLIYNDTVWEAASTPQMEAENVRSHVTGCWDWDKLDGEVDDVPSDLSEWEKI